ncbi:LmeA family phospholipid-binding protein [Williamsia sp. CHRR-6]|uniref:LmeA family phospholipid-binding protein n=1 Tax=Williamsia sp. CHRR-6 TaxID=2835871 RepID=UPI001BDB08BE|nr:LmeA family phospholipid-binding protein [Williamsia sp. CHRR-6]MBT0566932.1 DUF2993 domain-containing protein [Williamsia sp. CHRR-6]
MNDAMRPQNVPPTPPTRPIPTGGPARSPRKRSLGLTIAVSSLVVILVLLISGVGSELYLRSAARDCVQKTFTQITGSPTTASLSKKPILLQYFSKEIPYVQIDTTGDTASSIELHGRAEQIKTQSKSSTVGTLDASGKVSFARIVELSKQGAQDAAAQQQQNPTQNNGLGGLFGGFTLNQVTGDQTAKTIKVDATVTVAIFPVPVSVELKPVLTAGKISFQAVKASALVFGVPTDFAQTLVDGVSKSLFPPLFDQLTFTTFDVTSAGIDFAVNGRDVTLDEQSMNSTEQSTQSNSTCTIL